MGDSTVVHPVLRGRQKPHKRKTVCRSSFSVLHVNVSAVVFLQDLEAAFRASRRADAFMAIEKKGKAAFAKVI